MLEPATSVQFVKGIGPRLADVLGAKGIHTVDDLLHYLPFRYEDRLNPRGIAELRAGEMATVIAEVRTSGLFRTRRMPIFQMTAGQGKLTSRWFRRTIRTTLENLTPELPETIPAAVRKRLNLSAPVEALWKVHWPDAGERLQDLQSFRTPAHIRLIFEELFFIELGLELKRREQKAQTGIAFQLNEKV